jgi:hypothetical protein
MTIRDLIEEYCDKDDGVSKQICQLLECTQTFLSKTMTDFQVNRDKWINDQASLLIFNTLADGLVKFSKNPRKEPEITKIHNHCLRAIQERMDALKEKKDKIYSHYSTYENRLKPLMANANIQTTIKK